MIYAKRNAEGDIIAIYNRKKKHAKEELSWNHPDLIKFLEANDKHKNVAMLASDLEFIRVSEDLIDILIKKNIINITDFPSEAIEKILKRQKVRDYLSNAAGMEFDDKDV